METGKRIRDYRKKAGLSQKELGERLGVSQQHIAQYESGKRLPKLSTMVKLASALNIDAHLLTSAYQIDIMNRDETSFIIDINYSNKISENNLESKENIRLINEFQKLNSTGKKEAQKRVEELTEIPKYTKEE